MTIVTIAEDYIEISGHAPEKVVCHGISAVSQMTANYLQKCKNADITRKDGHLKMEHITQNDSSIFLLEAYIDALKDIQSEYPGNMIINFV